MSTLRVWLVGFGTVGRWLAGALGAQADQLASRYGRGVTVVGIGNARDGFIYHPDGLDVGSVLAAAAGGRPITEQPGARVWPTAIDGLRATEADLLVEVTGSPPAAGEPGLTHMREALRRGIPVVTSNKWPVALHGVELAELARRRGVAFRAESTVMSGTPVLSTLTEGLAGTVPVALRGLLNATANLVLSRMAHGTSYENALAAAQRTGLAERDPAADVEGHDTVAKLMILSALVFGRQLRRDQVACQGITGVTGQQARDAAAAGGRLPCRGARLCSTGRSWDGDRPGAARSPVGWRPAGPRRRRHQRPGFPGNPGRPDRNRRSRRRAAARRPGGARRHHRGRQMPGKDVIIKRPAGPGGAAKPPPRRQHLP